MGDCAVCTISLVVLLIASLVSYYAYTTERCVAGWIPNNITGLENTLRIKLHGQHLVTKVVVSAIRGHTRNEDPQKALVLSFHGPVGVGKSFVANLIIQQLYLRGLKSEFVHKRVGQEHYPHPEKLADYREDLKNLVKKSVKACERSLFLFEEVHEFPDGLLDALKPFLDHHAVVDGVDYRKAIFILTSETGYANINNFALQHWEKGGKREDITHKDMDNILMKHVFNAGGGLWQCKLIRHNMVSAFVAFLPLERRHIELCARDDAVIKKLPYTVRALSEVADELTYFPEGHEVFSIFGCKHVAHVVDFVCQ